MGVLLAIQKFAGAEAAQDIMVRGGFVVLTPIFLLIAAVWWILRRK